jgi:hypothetical protein
MTDPERQTDEVTWRNRFILLNLTRIGGTVLVLIGLLAWHGDLLVEGGTILIGLPLCLIGLAISLFGPRTLARRWREGER